MIKKIIISSMQIISLAAWAQTIVPTPVPQLTPTTPEVIPTITTKVVPETTTTLTTEINDGCPDYVPCDKETGKLLNNWSSLMKAASSEANDSAIKQFFENHGLPITLWYTGDPNASHRLSLIWDSPCKTHQRADNKNIYQIQSFIKKLPLPPSDPITSGIAIVKLSDKTIKFPTPARTSLLFLNGEKAHFQFEDQGGYVHYDLDLQGQISLTDKQTTTNFAKEALCPEDLSLEFQKLYPTEGIYVSHYCKEIWDIKNNTYQTILYGWSCN